MIAPGDSSRYDNGVYDLDSLSIRAIAMSTPTRIDFSSLKDERWEDSARGTIRYRTLISAPHTPTDSLVCGVAMMAAGDTFALHSHENPEIYFGLEGEGLVLIDGQPHLLAPGVAIFIPGGALHGVPLATSPLKWFYTFATDSFVNVRYSFPHEEENT
jgi:quercetin dioxygenase-like cupin family protein